MTLELGNGKRRFEALLTGAPAAAHDQPLLERQDWLVAPTLGALIPDWLLVIPRHPVLTFRAWAAEGGPSPLSVLGEVRTHLGLQADEVIWFEHGPATVGSVVGCGIDHAHLHILIRPTFNFSAFVDQVQSDIELVWRETSAADSYSALIGNMSYFVAGSGARAISAMNVETAGSQFFRRMIAALDGNGSDWDYRQFAYEQNIDATIATFKRLESVAQK